MNIVILWDADYPWDVRVEKIAKSLVGNSHNVHIVCRNLAKRRRIEETDGFIVHRLPNFPSERMDYMFQFPFFLNPIWLVEIIRIVRKIRAKIIIVRDLPMTPAALMVGKLFNTRVLFDMAEDYPAMLTNEASLGQKRQILDIIVRNPHLAKFVESLIMPQMDHTLVVVEESKQRLVMRGIDPEKISIIPNTPILSSSEETKLRPETSILAKEFRNRFSIVYHGGISPHRGLDVVILAVARLLAQNVDAHFYIFGKGNTDFVESIISNRSVHQNVHFLGWWALQDIMAMISHAKVGVVPHKKTPHTDTTIPNKLFDYMAVGLPVVVSDTIPMARIIREQNCGYIFESGSVDDLTNAFLRIYDNPCNELGIRGREAVQSQYNWEHHSNILLSVIEGLRDSC